MTCPGPRPASSIPASPATQVLAPAPRPVPPACPCSKRGSSQPSPPGKGRTAPARLTCRPRLAGSRGPAHRCSDPVHGRIAPPSAAARPPTVGIHEVPARFPASRFPPVAASRRPRFPHRRNTPFPWWTALRPRRRPFQWGPATGPSPDVGRSGGQKGCQWLLSGGKGRRVARNGVEGRSRTQFRERRGRSGQWQDLWEDTSTRSISRAG